jgi:uncharacterized membrane-anchored protein
MPTPLAPTQGTDYEISAPTQAALVTALKSVAAGTQFKLYRLARTVMGVAQPEGFTTGGVLPNGTVWALNYYASKMKPTGATTTDRSGNTVPVLAAVPGVFLILRLNGQTSTLPAAVITQLTAAGLTVTTPLPADSPYVFL